MDGGTFHASTEKKEMQDFKEESRFTSAGVCRYMLGITVGISILSIKG